MRWWSASVTVCVCLTCCVVCGSGVSVRTLQKLHAARLKVSFGDEVIAEQEREIEILTQEITRVGQQPHHTAALHAQETACQSTPVSWLTTVRPLCCVLPWLVELSC